MVIKTSPTKKSRRKAGKRKCRRCKEVFTNPINSKIYLICLRCRNHCVRCDILLTKDNYSSNIKKRNQYHCNPCISEAVRNTTNKDNRRDYDLLRNYGITINEYQKLFEIRNGVCWICGKPPVNNRLSVDHKHEKNEKKQDPRLKRKRVRGLLCWQCNSAIGKFKDDPNLLRNAAEYLEKNIAQEVLN